MAIIRTDDLPTLDELVELYGSVGWSAYTRDPARLLRGVRASLGVATAREGDRLVGLARVVGDGETIIYLQDVLVHPEQQQQGLGRALVEAVFEPYRDVRQHVLLTDLEERQRQFYEALGFKLVGEIGGRAFARYQP